MKILYVEDDLDIQEIMVKFLSRRYSNLEVASDGQEGLEKYKTFKPDLIITDIQMPKMNGFEMSELIRSSDTDVHIIITTAFNDTTNLAKGIDLGINQYILKPVDRTKLLQAIQRCEINLLQQKEIEEKNHIINTILEDDPNFTVICEGDCVKKVNSTFFTYLGYTSKEEFLVKNPTIQELCLNFDTYDENNKCWFEYLIDDEGLIESIFLNGMNKAMKHLRVKYIKFVISNLTLFEFFEHE